MDKVVDEEKLKTLFDIAVGSMDFSSGFLDHAEVSILREFAEILGINPNVGTPTNFQASFAHDFAEPKEKSLKNWNIFYNKISRVSYRLSPEQQAEYDATEKRFVVCGLCNRLETNPVHHGVTTTESTIEYEKYEDV